MAQPFDVSVLSDLGAQLAAWEDAYVSAVGFEKYRRASAWAASEAAKTVATRMRSATMEVIDRPTPRIGRAWQYTRALSQGGDAVSAEAFALDDQSVVLKFLMGDGPRMRLPGDVGLERERILVQNWLNLDLSPPGIVSSPARLGRLRRLIATAPDFRTSGLFQLRLRVQEFVPPFAQLCAMSGHQLDTRNRTFSFAPTPVLKPHPHNA